MLCSMRVYSSAIKVPASLARQMFFEDPNKVMIELNFPSGSCR